MEVPAKFKNIIEAMGDREYTTDEMHPLMRKSTGSFTYETLENYIVTMKQLGLIETNGLLWRVKK